MSQSQSLAYQAFGPTDAQTIVLLHGGGAGWWMWLPVIQHLSTHRCIAPDQPEHGMNKHIAPFSIEMAAEKVANLIRTQVRGAKAIVVGVSEGAQILTQLLAIAPTCVEKAVVSSALLLPIKGLSWLGSPTLLDWMYRLTVQPFKHNDRWIRLNMKYAAAVPSPFYPYFKKDFQTLTQSEFVNLLLANQQFRLPSGLGTVQTPTLVVAGRREYPAMKQSVSLLVRTLPKAQGAFLNLGRTAYLASEHNWSLTAPELFAQTVHAWTQGQTLPPELEMI